LTLEIVAVLAWAALATPATPAPASNDDCLACHADPAAVRERGGSVTVATDVFTKSVHGQAGVSCVDCHTALATAELPHPPKVTPASCTACHADAVTAHAAGAHGKPRGPEGRPAASCADCHGAHDIRPRTDPEARHNHFNVPRTCARCHGDAGGNAPGGPTLVSAYADSIHGRALSKSGLNVAPNCATCHGSHDVRPPSDAQSRVFHANVATTCGTCHAGVLPTYAESVHGRAVAAGRAAATCSDCHSAHGIRRAAGVPEWKLAVIRECGECHAESVRTYRDTLHGKVTNLGFTRVATCADCHGSHEIQPRSDPRSKVSAQQRAQTCTQCHTGANANFARYDPHADPEDPKRDRLLWATDTFMEMLLGGVFAFFALHTLLWFPRSWKERRRLRSTPPPEAAP
jgi:hypothetical protein